MISLLFNNSFIQRMKIGYTLVSFYIFISGVPRSQNILYSNLDYSVVSDGAPVIEIVSCLLSFPRVSLTVWAQAPSCMNKYSCFPSLLISGLFNSTLQYLHLPLYSVQNWSFNSFQYRRINHHFLVKGFDITE